MNYFVKDKLDQSEHEKVLNFLSSLSFYCIEQHPDWDCETLDCPKTFFYCTDDNQKVQCFANILLSKGPFKIANINFGPAFSDHEVLTKSIQFLHNYFSSNGFIFFSIQLGTYVNEKTELLEYIINKSFKVKSYFKPGFVWSSLSVDLTRSEDEIFQSFSKVHKQCLRNSYKKGLTISIQNDNSGLNAFIDLYIKMLTSRKLPYIKSDIISYFSKIFDFIAEYDKGFIGYIIDKDKLIGALIVIIQGNSARCVKNVTDPEMRNIPVMHFGFFESMKYCKEKGILIFDLWGYNHFVDENDQIFNINRFKRGFTHNFTFFPKRMHFELRPFLYKLFVIIKFLKMRIDRLLMKKSIKK
jgi:lipid II:glycine glycyltransferase (peptidoglycan interpeptide bridge formation enzyme)